ncbi:ABC transporter ATP-binding protein [Pikeienuella sp. HZG-20]|uniref:ABC transporter ATP-binding protein n=1 Tax=Paludibacillus litoralis TaxID=3133267 RepID=UPI0030ECA310
MNAPLLTTEDLTISFGGVHAVSGVSLQVEEKSLHAVIGPNGAGKTTFFHLLSGVYKPTRGVIRFRGEDITGLSAAQRVKLGIARSYQRTNIFPRLTVRENLNLAAARAAGEGWSMTPGATSPAVRAIVDDALALLSLKHTADQEAQTLPYGVQRLVDIGIALCCKPSLLLLDEPTSGLSSAELNEAVDILKTLRAHFTILLIEHNMELVIDLADRISVLDFGALLAEGGAEEIAANPEVQKAYFGSREKANPR